MVEESNSPSEQVDPALRELAPLHFPNRRSTRYSGEGLSVAFAEVHPEDQAVLRRMETFLADILALYSDRTPETGTGLVRVCGAHGFSDLVDEANGLGTPTVAASGGATVRQVFHDLKGGAFASLCLWLELLEPDGEAFAGARNVFFLARDHLKMLRNAVRGLSVEDEEEVRQHLHHGVGLLVDKWGDTVHRFANRELKVALRTSFSGNISESCLEFAALDRVFYNLVNNAARHGGGDDLHIDVFDPAQDQRNLRFVFRNTISVTHRHTLREQFPTRLSDIFLGGFTTRGSGIGTRVCTDFVTRAYGLESPEEAVANGYVGAAIHGLEFLSWFHWPIAESDVAGRNQLGAWSASGAPSSAGQGVRRSRR